ncbi:MAG: RNA polymerase sigma-70 factor [Bacteroidota bacterium]
MLNKDSKRQLIVQIANSDTIAFKQFFEIYYPRFYRFAFHFIKSDALAEEIVSDVFLKLWQNRKRLLFIEEIDAYFFRAIKNQSLTYLSKQSKANQDYSENSFTKLEYVQPENLMIAKELAEKIEDAISSLPERCEMIFRLIREDGMSYKNVAELLDISVKTVENQMGIAVKKLKLILVDFHEEKLLKNTFFSFLL